MIFIIGCFTQISLFAPTYAAEFEVIPEAKQDSANLGGDVDCVAGQVYYKDPKTQTQTLCKWVVEVWKDKDGKPIYKAWWSVRDRYNKIVDTSTKQWGYKDDVGAQFATWIFSWDGVLSYFVYIVRFISQIGLVIGAGMIIYTGYKYASAVFSGKSPSMSMITTAIEGILVIVFSYAIMRALTAAFL